MNWFVGRTLVVFGIAGPLIAAGIFLFLFRSAITNLGPFQSDALTNVLFGAYVIGLPPMIVTGLIVAAAGRRGRRLPTLTLLAAVAGFLLGGLSAFLWSVLGAPVIEDGATGVATQLLLGVAAIAAPSAFIATIFAGIVATASRPPPAENSA